MAPDGFLIDNRTCGPNSGANPNDFIQRSSRLRASRRHSHRGEGNLSSDCTKTRFRDPDAPLKGNDELESSRDPLTNRGSKDREDPNRSSHSLDVELASEWNTTLNLPLQESEVRGPFNKGHRGPVEMLTRKTSHCSKGTYLYFLNAAGSLCEDDLRTDNSESCDSLSEISTSGLSSYSTETSQQDPDDGSMPPNDPRCALLGDAFTFGVGVQMALLEGGNKEPPRKQGQGEKAEEAEWPPRDFVCTDLLSSFLPILPQRTAEDESQTFSPTTNLIFFNMMINACAAAGEENCAENWLNRMLSCGIAPSRVTYGTMCKAFARKGNIEAVERTMLTCESAGIVLNEYFYASLIASCGASQPPDKSRAEEAFAELVARGLRAQSVKRALGSVVGVARARHLFRTAGQKSTESAEAAVDAQQGHNRCPKKTREQNHKIDTVEKTSEPVPPRGGLYEPGHILLSYARN